MPSDRFGACKRRFDMNHVYDMIVIGGGPGGYTSALYASRAGLDTVVLERLCAGGQMALTGEVDNYPGFEDGINGFDLGIKMQRCAHRFGAKTVNCEVLSVDFDGEIKRINTSDGFFCGKTVVLASGANPRELGLPGEKELTGNGVHYCAHCDGGFYKDKKVIVVGGGNSAASDALYLSRIASKVFIVHRRDRLRADKIYGDPLARRENVEFVWNSTVSGLIADGRIIGAKVTGVVSEKTRDISCDGIFVSIGRTPATEFLSGKVQMDKNGYIVADESTRTDIPGVYAVGDVRAKALRQIVTAVSDGAVAVHFAEEYLAGQ